MRMGGPGIAAQDQAPALLCKSRSGTELLKPSDKSVVRTQRTSKGRDILVYYMQRVHGEEVAR